MLSQRGLTASRILARPFHRPATRSLLRSPARRYASHGPEDTGLTGAADNAFNRERLAVKKHAQETADFWRKLSLYVVIPALIIASANTWVQWNEHWEHQAHMPPIEKRTQYPYMNIRNKAYPWGDGDKTLFWNDKYNYKPPNEGAE